MNGTNDCIGYINKLGYLGTNYSPGQLILNPGAGGYANTNYVVDHVRHGWGWGDNLTGPFTYNTVPGARDGLIKSGVSSNAIAYADGLETRTNGIPYDLPHLTNAVNVAGYISWGCHSSLGGDYATNGKVRWTGASGWWIIETMESFNGQRATDQGNFLKWFSPDAFGGTAYSCTPVGAVSHVSEPGLDYVNDSEIYFRLWAGGKSFITCAWNSAYSTEFQAVGDPLVRK